MHLTPAIICTNRYFTEPLLPNFLVVLIKHVKEVLLNVIQVQEDAKFSALHLQNDLVDQLISWILFLVFWEIAPIEDFNLPLILMTDVLYKLQCVLLIVGDYH